MLDFRLETFLTLCETGSYTETAKLLHITQPAVSQHIKYLEKKYNCKLFTYSYKKLSLTSKGKLLKDYSTSFRASSNKVATLLQKTEHEIPTLNFGATLSIGEYVMPKILCDYLIQYPNINLRMYVDNTTSLLLKLDRGEIDFALIEGNFKKSDYEHHLISREKFIAVCSPLSPLSKGKYSLNEITNSRLITREEGSGTRSVLESGLYEHSLSINDFNSLVEISNFRVIKSLVANNIGITFAYNQVVDEDILNKTLCEINIPTFHITREFNFVYLKDSLFKNYYLEFYNYFKKHI